MATDLCEGVFKQILLKKRLKMTKRSNACLNFRSETCKNKVSFSVFFGKIIMFGKACQILRRATGGKLG